MAGERAKQIGTWRDQHKNKRTPTAQLSHLLDETKQTTKGQNEMSDQEIRDTIRLMLEDWSKLTDEQRNGAIAKASKLTPEQSKAITNVRKAFNF